ncbi:MAG: DUF732 domain-containing protein [Mycolicibacterium sp.]|uniref:DUF732 domain-containing protein n=1 Tax=Mycolicibacterium sp. TaxID=2320850 RepID=UPI003D12D167
MKALVRVLSAGLMSGLVSVGGLVGAQSAGADDLGFLVNVFQMNAFPFPNADTTLAYGRSICTRVETKMSYAELIGQVRAELQTNEFLAGYLISQAAEELCPEQIWQLRQSAAGYKPA